MESVGRIVCYGSKTAPPGFWYCMKHVGINRLYYIHSGSGGYVSGGKTYRFTPNTLYYIPYTADFSPFCDENDPVLHTFIDFELIPPILTNKIFSLEVKDDERILSALSVFVLGGKTVENESGELAALFADTSLCELCKASVIFLVSKIASENRIEKITDKVVIRALERMHTSLGEKLTVNDVARECFMNTDSFIRRFSRVVGVTPRAYLKNLRIRTACCLKETGMSLSEIALEVGYSDASALAHALKSEKTQGTIGM